MGRASTWPWAILSEKVNKLPEMADLFMKNYAKICRIA